MTSLCHITLTCQGIITTQSFPSRNVITRKSENTKSVLFCSPPCTSQTLFTAFRVPAEPSHSAISESPAAQSPSFPFLLFPSPSSSPSFKALMTLPCRTFFPFTKNSLLSPSVTFSVLFELPFSAAFPSEHKEAKIVAVEGHPNSDISP